MLRALPLIRSLAAIVLLGCQSPLAAPAAAPPEVPSMKEREQKVDRCADPTLINATVYSAPHAKALAHATIVIESGLIARIETSKSAEPVPRSDCVLDVAGRPVLAGFWNTHVHFTDPVFRDEVSAARRIEEMLLRFGFTSVVDTGADPRVIHPLREAIEARRIAGPRIVIAGGSFVHVNGTPSYLPKGLLPEIATPKEAEPAVASALALGANGIKIFSGSFQTPSHTIYLPPEVIAAITRAAHARGVFVVSHPTDREGLVNAVDNGVDVLAHTAPPAGVLEPELIERMKQNAVALTPTLKLWRWELERLGVPPEGVRSYVERGVVQLRDFHTAGGEVLFGTDVGYMSDYDTREEIELMQRAGLDFDDLLATLTTHPARRFSKSQGRVAVGEPADLVILASDPKRNPTQLSRVDVTMRAGRVVYAR